MHIGKVELLLTLIGHILSVLLTEEALTLFALTPLAVFLRSHQHRSVQVGVAQLRANDIQVQ